MHSIIKSLALVLALSSFAARADSEDEVVIRTRTGKSVQGRVISETKKGYLFAGPKGTSVIAFADIVDMKKVEVAPVEVTPVVVAPPPPPPAPALAEKSISEVISAQPVIEKVSREGFHLGVGANIGVRSAAPIATAQVHFDFNFGGPAYRITANFSSPAADLFAVHVDNFFHYNFGDVFSLGAGIEIGLAFGEGYNFVYIGPVIQPVIIKLGNRGQHQLSVTASVAALSTYNSAFRGKIDGTFQIFGGYSYFF